MKIRKFVTVIAIFSLLLCPIRVSAINEYSWFVKRNGNFRPHFTIDEEEFSRLNAYYLDNKVTDTSEDKVLYLTFDVGYENGNTAKILETLNEKNVPAAFFILDNIVLREGELLSRMIDGGHLICNHTKNHKNICSWNEEQICKNISELEEIYREKTGLEMAKYFRFPEGKYSMEAMRCISDIGYKTVFWSLAYADWDNNRQPSVDYALNKLIANTHNGAIVLLHSTSETNAKIMPTLIDRWREMGYRFATLNDLTN